MQALWRTDICDKLRMLFSCIVCDFAKFILRAYVIIVTVFVIRTYYIYSLLLYYSMSNYSKYKCDLMSVNWLYLNLYHRPHTCEKQFHCHLCNSTVVCIFNHYYLNTTEKLLLEPFDITLSVCINFDLEYGHCPNLENHIIQHYGENLHQCYVYTPKETDTQISDFNILKTLHDIYDLPISTCTICDFKCGNCCYFKSHLSLHTGENPFMCYMCHCKCRNCYYFKSYLILHTGENPCLYHMCYCKCGNCSYFKPYLILHTGEYLFLCHMCHCKCGNCCYFKIHQILHTGENPFLCHMCHCKCDNCCYFKHHLILHTGENPFLCHMCHFKCGNYCYGKSHLILHTGDNPFLCHMCHFKILVSEIIYHIYDSPYIELLDDVFYIQYFSFHCACSKITGFFKIREEYSSYIGWLLFWISHIMKNPKSKYLFYEKYSSSDYTHSKFIGSLKIRDDYNYYSRWLYFPMSCILFLTLRIGYIYIIPIFFFAHIEQLSTNSLLYKHVR